MSSPYHLAQDGSFIIQGYNQTKPFANFFPGVAGLYGIPMWAFYVNRGQGIASFGIESKDKAILEFQPANRSYRLTSIQGFRTFLKIKQGATVKCYEPFATTNVANYRLEQKMAITSHDLTIEEINKTLGISVVVNYFTLPHEPFAALVRRVTVKNLNKKPLAIDMVDGLPAVNPYGLNDWLGKHLSRTIEAWVSIGGLEKKMPFYQLKVVVADTPQVTPIVEGNFYMATMTGSKELLPIIAETARIFGPNADFLYPQAFYQQSKVDIAHQQTSNRTASAFAYTRFNLAANASTSLTAMAGYAPAIKELNGIAKKLLAKGFIDRKAHDNKQLIDGIKNYAHTRSANNVFDQYCGQTFLDNILRGGLPISLETSSGKAVFNVYSRKHGDLERDYNFFTLSPTYLSQGNGNYRDVNQNRRNDVFFNTDVEHASLMAFFNLLQADGYNPLVVKGTTFIIHDDSKADQILKEYGLTQDQALKTMLLKGFMPGELLNHMLKSKALTIKPEQFLGHVLHVSHKVEAADPGEGFWTDHWTYNLDLVESFSAVYPDKLKDLLSNKTFTYYYSDFYHLPRDSRYVLTPRGVRQYHSLEEHDKSTQAKAKGHFLRTNHGKGEIYRTDFLNKLICLLVNKAATLDPSGIGIEMEANKPNWYDSLNGLPGLLGSSISESFEVKRFAQFVLHLIEQFPEANSHQVKLFIELADFVEGLANVLSTTTDPLEYWRKANDLKESYRLKIRYGIDGQERDVSIKHIKHLLVEVIKRIDTGITQATDAKGLFPTYFYHEVTAYDLLDKHHGQDRHVRPTAFKRHDLPLFLEGFVHALRVMPTKEEARKLHQAVSTSALFDKKLAMYKVNASLKDQTDEIGRTRIFPSGWLENESVWLHMAYKYYLEILRNGLAAEFYQAIKTGMVCFMKPEVYGRSVLENSSFIASSAHPDASLHGQGFVARLSGSTAEFLHIWLLMNVGQKPFRLNNAGELVAEFKPVLSKDFFTQKQTVDLPAGAYRFKFLGHTMVTYLNPKRCDTFGVKAVEVKEWHLYTHQAKKPIVVQESVLTQEYALALREGKYPKVDILLG